MTVSELARLVKSMRESQKLYFRARTTENLSSAKAIESQVDTAVAHVLSGPSLFDDKPDAEPAPRKKSPLLHHHDLGGEG